MEWKEINTIGLISSGLKGSGIACLFANAGKKVWYLDLSEKIKTGTPPTAVQAESPIRESLKTHIQSHPFLLYKIEHLSRIDSGIWPDEVNKIRECEWIIVAIDDFAALPLLFSAIDDHKKPGSIISLVTDGQPIGQYSEGRSNDFRNYFCGLRFFNPPRYNQLLEIIPGLHMDPELLPGLEDFGNYFLGKEILISPDIPGFLAGRIGIFYVLQSIRTSLELGFNVNQTDMLTGLITGTPKTGVFRTLDKIGINRFARETSIIFNNLFNDPYQEAFRLPDVFTTHNLREDQVIPEPFFYSTREKSKRESAPLVFDWNTSQYRVVKKLKIPKVYRAKKIDSLSARYRFLLKSDGKVGIFYRTLLYSLFEYISHLATHISVGIYKIDRSLCFGYEWKKGPFEIWESLGIKEIIEDMSRSGYTSAAWVGEMISNGNFTFYRLENGKKKYFDPATGSYKKIPGPEGLIILDQIRDIKTVWKNAGSSIIDIGDGILNIEFHNKMNLMGKEVLEGLHQGIEIAEKDFRGVVIGNDGPVFTAGANLGILFIMAIEQAYDKINEAIRYFQETILKIRYSSIPVVVAPHHLTLGGGCELTLHADAVQATPECYIGLVEVKAGLIPAGCGTKEMVRRLSATRSLPGMQVYPEEGVFQQILEGKISSSAYEAMDMHYVPAGSPVSMNVNLQINEAKKMVLALALSGYQPPLPDNNIKVCGRAGLDYFHQYTNRLIQNRAISPHEIKIAGKLAWVMCGGDQDSGSFVSESYLLDLEREAFLSLCGERKTLERIRAIVQGQKPPRN